MAYIPAVPTPKDDGGVWSNFGALPAESHHVDIEMTNGQMLPADVVIKGQTSLPLITGGMMSAVYHGGELELSWANPSGAANWPGVDQLCVVIYDGTGLGVLHISLLSTETLVQKSIPW